MASIKHQTNVNTSAIQGIPASKTPTPKFFKSWMGMKNRSWMRTQIPSTINFSKAIIAVTSTNRNLRIPPQNEKMALPRSHQIKKKVITNSVLCARKTTESTQGMVTQQARMMDRTGKRRNSLFNNATQKRSSAPKAKFRKSCWKRRGKNKRLKMTFQAPDASLNMVSLSPQKLTIRFYGSTQWRFPTSFDG